MGKNEMKLGRLNHIGVVTPSIPESIAHWRDVMGATKIHDPFDLPAQGVKVCFVDTPGANGTEGSQIELIEPLGEDSPRSEEHTSELQSRPHLVCRLLL